MSNQNNLPISRDTFKFMSQGDQMLVLYDLTLENHRCVSELRTLKWFYGGLAAASGFVAGFLQDAFFRLK